MAYRIIDYNGITMKVHDYTGVHTISVWKPESGYRTLIAYLDTLVGTPVIVGNIRTREVREAILRIGFKPKGPLCQGLFERTATWRAD